MDMITLGLDPDQYLSPIPRSIGAGSHTTMSLEDFFGHADASTLGNQFSDPHPKRITLKLSSRDKENSLFHFKVVLMEIIISILS